MIIQIILIILSIGALFNRDYQTGFFGIVVNGICFAINCNTLKKNRWFIKK